MDRLRGAVRYWKDVHPDPCRLWYLGDGWRSRAQHCPRRIDRRRNSDLPAGCCSMVSALDGLPADCIGGMNGDAFTDSTKRHHKDEG